MTSDRVSGEKNPRSKLTWEEVRKIRAKASREYCDRKALSEEFGVTEIALSKVLTGRTWKDPLFNPGDVISAHDYNRDGSTQKPVWRSLTNRQVDDLRLRYLAGSTLSELKKDTGLPSTSLSRYLFLKYGTDEIRKKCVQKRGKVKHPNPQVLQHRKDEAVARWRAGESQSKIAQEYGVSQTTVSNWAKSRDKL